MLNGLGLADFAATHNHSRSHISHHSPLRPCLPHVFIATPLLTTTSLRKLRTASPLVINDYIQHKRHGNTHNGLICYSSSQYYLLNNPHGNSSASDHAPGIQDNSLADNYSGEEAIDNNCKAYGTLEGNRHAKVV